MEDNEEFENSSNNLTPDLRTENPEVMDVEKENSFVLRNDDIRPNLEENIPENPLNDYEHQRNPTAENGLLQPQIANLSPDLTNVVIKAEEIEDQYFNKCQGSLCDKIKNEFIEDSLIIESTEYISEDSLNTTESFFVQTSADSASTSNNESFSFLNVNSEMEAIVGNSILGNIGVGKIILKEKNEEDDLTNNISNISASISDSYGNQNSSKMNNLDFTVEDVSNSDKLGSILNEELVEPMSSNVQFLPLYIQIESKDQDIHLDNTTGENISCETLNFEGTIQEGLLTIDTSTFGYNGTPKTCLKNEMNPLESSPSQKVISDILQSITSDQVLDKNEYGEGCSIETAQVSIDNIINHDFENLSTTSEAIMKNKVAEKSEAPLITKDSVFNNGETIDLNSLKLPGALMCYETPCNTSQSFSPNLKEIKCTHVPIEVLENECVNESMKIETVHCINESVFNLSNFFPSENNVSGDLLVHSTSSNSDNVVIYNTDIQNEQLIDDKLKDNLDFENIGLNVCSGNEDVTLNCNEDSSGSLSLTQQLYSVNMQTDEMNGTKELSISEELSQESIDLETDSKGKVLNGTPNEGSLSHNLTIGTDPLQSFCLSQSLYQPHIESLEQDDIDNQTTFSNKDMNITWDTNNFQSLVSDLPTENKEPTFDQTKSDFSTTPLFIASHESINFECVPCDESVLLNDTALNEQTIIGDPLKSFCLDESLKAIMLKPENETADLDYFDQNHVTLLETIQEEYIKLTKILAKTDHNSNEVLKMKGLNDSLSKLVKLMVKKQKLSIGNKIKSVQSLYTDINISDTEDYFDNFELLHKTKLIADEQDNNELLKKIQENDNLRIINSLKEDKASLLAKINMLEIQLKQTDTYKEENMFFFNKIKDLELELDTFSTIQDENKMLKEQLVNLDMELKKTSILEEELEYSFQIVENKNYQLSDEIKQCEIELNKLEGVEEENAILFDKVLEGNWQLEEVKLLREECELLFYKIREIKITISDYASVQEENTLLLKKVQKLENQLNNTTKNIEELQAMKNDLLSERLNEFESVETENTLLKQKLQDADQTLEKLISMEKENALLSEQMKEFEETLTKMIVIENEHTLLSERVKEFESVETENTLLKQKLQESDQTLEKTISMEKENALLSEQMKELESVKTENIFLRQKVQEFEETLTKMTVIENEHTLLSERVKEFESIETENTSLKQKLQESDQTLEKLISMEKENALLSEQMKELESVNGENIFLKQKVQEFEETLTKMTVIENEHTLLSDSVKEFESVETENTLLKQKLQDSRQTLEKLKNKYEEKINTLVNENKNLCKQLEYLKVEKNEFRQMVDDIEANIERWDLVEEENMTLCNKVKVLESELENSCVLKLSLVEEIATLKEQLIEFGHTKENILQENLVLCEKLKDSENMRIELELLKVKLKEFDESIERLSNNKSEKMIYENKIESVNKENALLKEKLIEFDLIVEKLSLFENEKSNLSKQVNDLEFVSSENTILKQKLNELEQIQKSLREEIDENIIEINNKQNVRLTVPNHCKCIDNESNLKALIIKEIFSLNPNITEDLVKYEITSLFTKLLEVFVEKEQELVLALQQNFQTQKESFYNELANKENEIEQLRSQMTKSECQFDNKISKANENLKSELENHEKKLSEINDILITKDSLIISLNNQITHLSENNLLLSETVTNEKNKNIEFSEIISKFNEDLKNQELNLRSLSDELKQKDVEISHFQTLVANTEDQRKVHDSMLQVISSLESENLLMVEECKQLCKHLGNNSCGLKSTLNNIVNNFTLLKSIIQLFTDRITEEDNQHKSQIESFRIMLIEKDTLYDKLKESTDDINSKLSVSVECQNKLSREIENKESEFKIVADDLQRKIEEHSNICIKFEKRDLLYNQLKEEFDKLKEKNKELQTEVLKLKDTVSELETKVEDYSGMSTELKELQVSLEKARTEIKNYNVDSVKMCKEIENLNALYKLEKHQNNNLALKVESLVYLNKDLNSRNVLLEEKIKCGIQLNENHDLLKKFNHVLQVNLCNIDEVCETISCKIATIKDLQQKLSQLKEENSQLNSEYGKMKGYVKQQEIELAVLQERESKLKDKYDDLLVTFDTHRNPNICKNIESTSSLQDIENTLVIMFPGIPSNLFGAIQRIKEMSEDYDVLKNKVIELQEEKDSIDKECDNMYEMIKSYKSEIAQILRREDSTVTELKYQLQETKKEKDAMDKECDNMYNMIKSHELEMVQVLHREDSTVTELKNQLQVTKQLLDGKISSETAMNDIDSLYSKINMYENLKEKHDEEKQKLTSELQNVCDELQKLKEERKTLNNEVRQLHQQLAEKSGSICQCDELKSQISEMKVTVADKSAKITTLELQIECENYNYKKQCQELEHVLEQSKNKIKDLKSDVRRYQMQAHEASVYDCQKCRRRNERKVHAEVQTADVTPNPSSCVEGHGMMLLEKQLHKANKEIEFLKKLCRLRNAKLNELQQATGKPSRSSVLKENNQACDEKCTDLSPKTKK